MQFNELQLNNSLLEVLKAKGYVTPSPIQQQAIPPVLAGEDVLGLAQTGTGKTAAFALPILHRLLAFPKSADTQQAGTFESNGFKGKGSQNNRYGRKPGRGAMTYKRPSRNIRALVLAPTRELASQINDSFRAYGKKTPIRTAAVFGGVPQGRQLHELRSGIDVLVACPGRLLDLMNQGHIRLDSVEYVVLDEADRMLDMGFIPDIRKILSKVPDERQNMLFSATMPPEIERLVADFLKNPVRVEIAPVAVTTAQIDQKAYYVNQSNKPALLNHLLLDEQVGLIRTTGDPRVLVFTRTRRAADRVTERLEKSGVRAECIHGSKSQAARERALRGFKRGSSPVMVATDLAARGLDVTNITHVVNYDLPNEPETFVHRVGRTGRAGATGIAISFCDSTEAGFLNVIEKLLKVSLPKVEDHPHHCQIAASAHQRSGNRPTAPSRNQGGYGRKKYSGGGGYGQGGRRKGASEGGDRQWRKFPPRRKDRGPHLDNQD